jgi:hypothetical protein
LAWNSSGLNLHNFAEISPSVNVLGLKSEVIDASLDYILGNVLLLEGVVDVSLNLLPNVKVFGNF